jgi:xanthine dehydrogenase YagS FAD-binding subunit
MKIFQHTNAKSVADAMKVMSEYGEKAMVIAGGTDLLGLLKSRAAPIYPEILVNLKTIPGLNTIQIEDPGLIIGATAKLAYIANFPLINEEYPILAAAAHSVAMPQIRNMGTIGGNLAQETRCWYYRYQYEIGGRIMCARKGEGACLAVKGDNRYHALFGARKCFAVCPSDMAVALEALDAKVRIIGPGGERLVAAADFYHPMGNALEPGEIITHIKVPRPAAGNRQVFIKHRVRDSIDFAVVSVGLVNNFKEGICIRSRIVLGAVAAGPYRAIDAEKALTGGEINNEIAETIAARALAGAVPLSRNGYKIEVAKTLVKRALLS